MKFRIFLLAVLAALLAACAAEKAEQDANERTNALPGPDLVIDNLLSDDRKDASPGNEQPRVADEQFRESEEHDVAIRRMQLANKPAMKMLDQAITVTGSAVTRAEPGRQAEGFACCNKIAANVTATQSMIRHASDPLYRENYEHPDNNGVFRVSTTPVSTFSIDVDTGAYSNMRRWLNHGQLPPQNAVRTEEFINYFTYDYPVPEDSGQPFLVSTEIAPTPWNKQTHLLRIGIQGYQARVEDLPESNLVFLIDVSGSMQSADKIGLLKNAMSMLTNKLDKNDHISVVVYAGASGVVLEPTSGDRKDLILGALEQLQAGGSTNGGAGIKLAYRMARQHFRKDGVNRVLLATDGDFNVGLASHDELIDLIEKERKSGIALTTLGFGSGNYNDHLLEQLADAGNGNYAYIDRLSEARKVLAEELSATLMTIAKDVKIQIEFNPENVTEYRLIGYENRLLNEEDFNNDKIDAGEIGAGHRVTALYEISLAGSGFQRLPDRRYGTTHDLKEAYRPGLNNELAHLRIRFKQPDEDRSQLIETPIMLTSVKSSLSQGSDNLRFAAAVAAFGQKLRGGDFLDDFGYAEIRDLAANARGNDAFGYRGEFLQLVGLADSLDNTGKVAMEAAPDGR
jgi:Ca-activated chloride channel family protein